MRDPLLKSYLTQHGITEEALVGGQKVLFVDTGFSGTIPKVIGENFSVSARQNLKTHLIVSSNEAHPSSRSFLVHLNPFVVNGNPASMHASVVSYEHMPRYTDRSTSFFAENGAYHPISNLKTANDGSVSKEISVKYIQDLKAAWSTHEVQKRYKIEKQAFKALYEITKTKASIEDLLRLKAQLESTFDQVFVEAMFKDAAEIQQRINESQSFEVTSLGYKESFTSASSKKNHLIKDYPQWANILEDPIGGIEHLVKTKDWVTLGALIDANVDHEFNKILAQNLFKRNEGFNPSDDRKRRSTGAEAIGCVYLLEAAHCRNEGFNPSDDRKRRYQCAVGFGCVYLLAAAHCRNEGFNPSDDRKRRYQCAGAIGCAYLLEAVHCRNEGFNPSDDRKRRYTCAEAIG